MTHQFERPAPLVGGTGLTNGASTHQTPTQVTAPTQRDRVLAMLASDEAVCATTLFRAFIPRAAAVVHRLRREGYVIWSRSCSQDHAHAHPQIEYVLVALPEGRMNVG